LTRFVPGLVIGCLLAGLIGLRAEEPDAKYLRIYYAIEKADGLVKRGDRDEAKAKYQEAQTLLKELKSINPTWNSKAVAYRLSYVTDQIDALSHPPAALATQGERESKGAGPISNTASGLQVKLLSAGGEPRQVLKLSPKVGDVQTAMMTLQLGMGMAGAAELMKIPPVGIALRAEVKSVAPNGDIASEVRIEDVNVEADGGGGAQMAEAIKASLGGMKGMVIANTISDRGMTKQVEMKFPPGSESGARQSVEQMKESILNLQLMLPEAAIGPDASWEIKQKIKAQGMTIDQTTTHHLVAVEGGKLTIESSVGQSAANQKIANPAMPQLKVNLTRMTGTSKGRLTTELTKILPVSATMEGGSEMILNAGAGAQAQPMTMRMDVRMKIESK